MHIAYFADRESNFSFNILGDSSRISSFQYKCPTNVIAGHGSLSAIYKEVASLGCRRALILTDPGVRKAGLARLAEDALAAFCAGVFDRIAQDTDLDTVDAATATARDLKADCLVSVGGGSVIDTGKAVSVALKNGGKANDHIALFRLTEPQTPHIVIPTTAGTGSEVTNVAVIKSKIAGRKVYIVDTNIMPNSAILDPRFTMTMPPGLTATTAMDALTHAVEALTSTMSNRICDGQALQAIRLIGENLPPAVADGRNENARLNMQVAATLAGWAFTIAQVGLVHAMAHTLGVLHNVPHGAACGILLPKVMRFNGDHAQEKFVAIAQALGADTAGREPGKAAAVAAEAVENLMKKANHPLRLRDVGVPEEGLGLGALHAIADTPSLFNARPVNDPGEVLEIFKQAY
jgi:alcohol dehydrogenase class IV